MKIENHVTNRELSQKLVDAGIVIDSVFYWYHSVVMNEWILMYFRDIEEKLPIKEYIPAPLASELGEVIEPHNFIKQKNSSGFFWRLDIEWRKIGLSADTETNARALMILYLAKKGLLSVEKKL